MLKKEYLDNICEEIIEFQKRTLILNTHDDKETEWER
jgi:hypothetical protein